MPHPTWDETQPLGTAPSNTIDEIIRQLKAEIRERMNDFVVDWTANPVVLQPIPAATLPTGGATIIPPHGLFVGGGLGTIAGVTPSFVSVTGDAILPLPISEDLGAMYIDKVYFVINSSGTPVDWSLSYQDFPGTTSTVAKSGTDSNATPTLVTAYDSSVDGEMPVNAVRRFTLSFDAPGTSWTLFSTKIVYHFVYS